MPVETSATFLSDLVPDWPIGASDFVKEGDDHFRLIKKVLQNTFPGMNAAVTMSAAKLNLFDMGFNYVQPTTSPVFTGYWQVVDASDGSGLSPYQARSITDTETDVKSHPSFGVIWQDVINLLMPVGHILPTRKAGNPSTWLGFGTWVQRSGFVAGAGTATDSTGASSVISATANGNNGFWRVQNSHIVAQKLSIADGITAEHAAINIGYTGKDGTGHPDGSTDDIAAGNAESYPRQTQNFSIPAFKLGVTGDVTIGSGTTSDAHQFSPPFVGVYIWERTA